MYWTYLGILTTFWLYSDYILATFRLQSGPKAGNSVASNSKAAQRKEVAGRTERLLREGRIANWMAGKVGKRRAMPETVVICIFRQLSVNSQMCSIYIAFFNGDKLSHLSFFNILVANSNVVMSPNRKIPP